MTRWYLVLSDVLFVADAWVHIFRTGEHYSLVNNVWGDILWGHIVHYHDIMPHCLHFIMLLERGYVCTGR